MRAHWSAFAGPLLWARFVEQVFGAYLLGNTPATGVIDLTPNPAPASVYAPIVVHILQVRASMHNGLHTVDLRAVECRSP